MKTRITLTIIAAVCLFILSVGIGIGATELAVRVGMFLGIVTSIIMCAVAIGMCKENK